MSCVLLKQTLMGAAENQIKNHWLHPVNKTLSDYWTGTTMFFLRMPPPEPGKKWAAGRQVEIRKGKRTETMRILPEIWRSMNEKDRTEAEEEGGWKARSATRPGDNLVLPKFATRGNR